MAEQRSPACRCLRVVCLGVVLAAASFTCLEPFAGPPAPTPVESLRAFAKLYGYVRFFHPSEEASEVDWDRLAIRGAGRVKGARSGSELRRILEELFLPLAPSARIYPTGAKPPEVDVSPADRTGLEVVAWQHMGVGLGQYGNLYKSKRLNRTITVAEGGGTFGPVSQSLDAAPHRGKQIRLRAQVRAEVEGTGNQGQLWLRVDRPGGEVGFFDTMADRPITDPEWRAYEIQGAVADDASSIVFGSLLAGAGRIHVDAFELSTRAEGEEWKQVPIKNPGFEEGEEGAEPIGWGPTMSGYRCAQVGEQRVEGARSLLVEMEAKTLSEPLFEGHPEVGEAIDAPLGAGLSAHVPLALWGDESTTWAPASGGGPPTAEDLAERAEALERLKAELATIEPGNLTAEDEDLRLGDVVIAWNIFQHFYPYFDVVAVDWDRELERALQSALRDRSVGEFLLTLRRLAVALQDGHAMVAHPDHVHKASLPAIFDWVEDQVVVSRSFAETLRRGDRILEVDGAEAGRMLREAEALISGSPQWKRRLALRDFGDGDAGTKATLSIAREGERLRVEVERKVLDPRASEFDREEIQEIEEGIFYVDLGRAGMASIVARLDEIAAARGVVFDLRGYPKGNHAVISHLLTRPDESDAWTKIPRIIYPDHVEPAGWDVEGWELEVAEPHISGKVVFLTDGRAISYAECIMSFVEAYGLAEIVGQPTAGTNGNINRIQLPGQFRINWTGMKVVKHDGSRQHLIGILPTVPAKRTLRGVTEGLDEFLEKALEIIRALSSRAGRQGSIGCEAPIPGP